MTPQAFAELMQRELDANNVKKGDFSEWHPSAYGLMSEMWHHFTKLTKALDQKDATAVTEYAADIGNYCMKAVEDFGTTGEPP